MVRVPSFLRERLGIDGVTLVKVFYDKRQAAVVFENTVVDIQQFSEAIEKIGFSSRLLKLTTF